MTSIIIGIIAFVLGTGGTLVLLRVFNKRARLEAEAEAELLKKNKLIEAKEKFIALKAEHEQHVMQRNSQVTLPDNAVGKRTVKSALRSL